MAGCLTLTVMLSNRLDWPTMRGALRTDYCRFQSFEFCFPRCPFLSRPGGHGEMGSIPARRAALRASASGLRPHYVFMVPPKIDTT
jgi:hypothetical protein